MLPNEIQRAIDRNRLRAARLNRQGTFPYKCQTCGVVCESVDELSDPDHHDWPGGNE